MKKTNAANITFYILFSYFLMVGSILMLFLWFSTVGHSINTGYLFLTLGFTILIGYVTNISYNKATFKKRSRFILSCGVITYFFLHSFGIFISQIIFYLDNMDKVNSRIVIPVAFAVAILANMFYSKIKGEKK